MTTVQFDITTSLDGYVAGPNDGPDNGLGDNGEALHEWILKLASWRESHGHEGGVEGGREDEMMARALESKASIVGRRMYENAGGWGDEPPFKMPVFVLSSEEREPRVCDNGTTFTFVSDPDEALAQAKEVAGSDGVIAIGGGAQAIRTYIEKGAVDRFTIHVAPLLLGGGVRLFEGITPEAIGFHPVSAYHGELAAHIDYEVDR
jgi:dihydrofolate reductase